MSGPNNITNRSVSWTGVFKPCGGSDEFCPCGGEMWGFVSDYLTVLRHYEPKVVYEWGLGMSTGLALGAGAAVYTVEHDREYIRIPMNIAGLCACYHIPQFSDQYPKPRVDEVDLYFVDGRRRADCIITAADIVAEPESRNSVLCLHDAQRPRYHAALHSWPHVHFMSRGFAVASFEPISELMKPAQNGMR